METILLHSRDGVNFRPIKGTTKQQCYNVLGEIQSLLKTNVVNIPANENELILNGIIYNAVVDKKNDCSGCALDWKNNGLCGENAKPCSSNFREDGRSVIWVPANKCTNECVIIVNGRIYHAVPAPNYGHCDGCDLLPTGKESCGGLWKIYNNFPFCSADWRLDKVDVIWKQKTGKNESK